LVHIVKFLLGKWISYGVSRTQEEAINRTKHIIALDFESYLIVFGLKSPEFPLMLKCLRLRQ